MSEIPQTLAEAFIRTTRRVPEKEAVVSADGRRYTYGEVRTEVDRLATALHVLGCKKGDRVAVWLANSPEWVFAEFACTEGAALVPSRCLRP